MNIIQINSSSVTGISEALLNAPFQLNIYLGAFIFVTGNISSIGNFIVFSSRTFRARACSLYLITESIFSFIYFNYVLVTRVIQKGFRLPIIDHYDPICKIREFLSEYTHQVAFTLFILATVDRFLSTHRSVAYRKWSNRATLAYKLIPTVILTWFVLVCHRLFLYSIASGTCQPEGGFYERYDSFFEAIMSGLCPPTIIITLGCFLLRNVRRVAQRKVTFVPTVSQTTDRNQLYMQQIDAQLTRMLLLQSFVAIPSFLPFGAQNLYSSITLTWHKSPMRLAWENVFIELIRLFSYLFYSTSFYVSFLCSRGFRRQVFLTLRIKRYTREVQPTGTNNQLKSTNATRKTEQKEI